MKIKILAMHNLNLIGILKHLSKLIKKKIFKKNYLRFYIGKEIFSSIRRAYAIPSASRTGLIPKLLLVL